MDASYSRKLVLCPGPLYFNVEKLEIVLLAAFTYAPSTQVHRYMEDFSEPLPYDSSMYIGLATN